MLISISWKHIYIDPLFLMGIIVGNSFFHLIVTCVFLFRLLTEICVSIYPMISSIISAPLLPQHRLGLLIMLLSTEKKSFIVKVLFNASSRKPVLFL